jgi:hypothetical protein
VLRHVDRAYCLSVYNARKTQTITITTTMVPNSPYPNIVASSGFLGFRIPMNHFAPSALRCMFDSAHNSNNLWDTAVLLRRFNAGFIFLARWLLVAFPHSLNSCKCGSIGFLLAEPHRFVTKTDQKRNCAKLNSQESWLFLKSSNVSRDVTDGPGKAGR